jgi:membrane-bound metal-dependent hydrolase YbcI (DUF457 family)
MFTGHALLAFALAALFAEWRGWRSRQALAVGITAGAFAALPDIDVLYALVAMNPTEFVAGGRLQPEAFWEPANVTHRLMTHSLVVAALAGPAFGLWTFRGTAGRRLPAALAVVTLAGLVVAVAAASGVIGAVVLVAFALVGLAIAELSRTRLGLSPQVIAVAATAGVASHPFGDLVTGEPPALFYPFEWSVLSERVVLSSDPTLHLLGAFGLELAVAVLAAAVVARHAGYRPHRLVDRRALIGVVYGVSAVVMTPPTIHLSYQFVGSILVVGGVCGAANPAVCGRYPPRAVADRLVGSSERALRTVLTSLTAIAVALVSYGAVYLLIG